MTDIAERPAPRDPTADSFADLRALVGRHIGTGLRWYDVHASRPRYWFRIFGSLTILLSISLPVVSSLPATIIPQQSLVVSLIALGIALIAAFSTFFRWNEAWHANIRAKLELESLLYLWELQLLEAKQFREPDKQVQAAIAATRQLFTEAAKVDMLNTEGYFRHVGFPSTREQR